MFYFSATFSTRLHIYEYLKNNAGEMDIHKPEYRNVDASKKPDIYRKILFEIKNHRQDCEETGRSI
ncbi:protein of unknown function [Maridesulfovibrio hydrothermalis AM13 = DSM 14728]|uniref:Uncharacterized protein n=1 Tax=Maridesulfovibrio hydrothermalis AM13 = DSM 14728 TaxID=1121451 RepID=L0R970_9BACT|nr:protein of unknown function [Maridesulfovibrio hydrothermalis AM13 = DSM 14728]